MEALFMMSISYIFLVFIYQVLTLFFKNGVLRCTCFTRTKHVDSFFDMILLLHFYTKFDSVGSRFIIAHYY